MTAAGVTGFTHEAFLYADLAEFLDGTCSFVRDGLDRDELVLVATGGDRLAALRSLFGGEPDVAFADMADLGANPSRIIPAWRSFLDDALDSGRGARGIGEPVWPGRSEAENAECFQHESLLNVAFDDGPPWRLLCPYDATGLTADVLDGARTNHPFVVEHGQASASPGYDWQLARAALNGPPLPPPGGPAIELAFSAGELVQVRRLVQRCATGAGLAADAVDDLVLGVDEVAANSLLHAGGTGWLRIWSEPDTLVAEVRDGGTIANPLIGREEPAIDGLNGRGIWMANQLCSLVQVRSGPDGTTVRMHARLGAPEEQLASGR